MHYIICPEKCVWGIIKVGGLVDDFYICKLNSVYIFRITYLKLHQMYFCVFRIALNNYFPIKF